MTTQSAHSPPDVPAAGGDSASFEEVLEFYTRAGFLYSAKLAALDGRLDRVAGTWRRLLAADGDIFKMVLIRRPEEGRLVAKNSVCAFAYAPGVFHVQHLVSSDRHERAGTLAALLEITDWLRSSPGLTAYRLSYRPDNPGAGRLFGGLAELMPAQRTHTSLTTYRLIADLRGLPEPEPATRIRAACATDVPVVDQLYGTAHPAVPDWMAVTDLDQTVLGARYRAYGLERRRIILVAEHEGSVCGTVACWWASEGMSFSFLENAATDLYVTTSLPEDQRRRVAFSLVVAALRLYAALGRPYAVLVLDDEIERLVKGLPLLSTVPVKRYANVTVSAEDLPATRAYWEKFYAAQPQAGEIEWMAAG